MNSSRVLVVSKSGRLKLPDCLDSIFKNYLHCLIEQIPFQDIKDFIEKDKKIFLTIFLGNPFDDNTQIGRDSLQLIHTPKILMIEDKDDESISLLNDFDDILFSPITDQEVLFRISRLIRKIEHSAIRKNLIEKLGIRGIIGKDDAFLDAVHKIPKVADTEASILIFGETGSGKSVFARAIHYLSSRAKNAFIPIECGSIPNHLLENDLFGHSKGAFTDAKTNKMGIVVQADGGTLFLDEIDTLNMEAQGKILHLIEDKHYRPIGHTKMFTANVRIIAATNRDLEELVKEGKFRQDLYYRLNVKLRIPPLRERKTDIPILANFFIQKQNTATKEGSKWLSNSAMQMLLEYEWPGNIRELENVIQQAFLFSESNVIQSTDFDFLSKSKGKNPTSFSEAKRLAIESFEKEYLKSMLLLFNGNISAAAREAKKDRRDFGRLVQKYNLEPENYKAIY
jgi:two-component system, NtrC family, response regulator GlrR